MKKIVLPLAAGMFLFSCSLVKPRSQKSDKAQSGQQVVAKPEGIKGDTVKKTIKPYKEVITDKAVTQKGLFKVHKVNERYFFEIPDSVLAKDILVVSRISQAAAGSRPVNGYIGYGGDYIGENQIEFVKGPNQKIFIKRISYLDVAHDSSENGMYRSVYNSSLQPIVAAFDVKAVTPDSAGSVIDLTDYINGDNDVLFFDPKIKSLYGLGALQADKSYIQTISSFPENTEIQTVKTYLVKERLLTYGLNTSFVLLPAQPMRPRYFNERVGYFSRGYRDFDAPQEEKATVMITRWRMEPKEADREKYVRGELVEPEKPIVFYIDPATPKKWVPYLIQGVNAWQKAFEKAGFKKAIYAIEAPVNDSSWSLNDARHNVIVYKASYAQNASGPHVHDPRTGEILETHINWYHNIQKILHDWYFVQASPNDPRGRKMQFDDSLMGQLIQYVCTHEVGHTLGLQHNFFASGTVPTDSLRSKSYVSKWGHTPSVMDYARFNYVAQPEDSIDVKDLIPRIGIYDEWAIEWGYRWLPAFQSREAEKEYMNQWIIQSLAKDKRCSYGGYESIDSRNGPEDLGDDPVKASTYGIKNLKRVMAHLVEWTKVPYESYDNMIDLKKQIWYIQYWQYLTNVVRTIGGVYWTPKTYAEDGPVLTWVPKEKQRAAVQFFQEQLFDTPKWMDDKKLFSLIGGGGFFNITSIQEHFLGRMIEYIQYGTMAFNKAYQSPKLSYGFDELLTDLETGIWKELKSGKKIEVERQALQKAYATKLIDFIRANKSTWPGIQDGCTIVEDHLQGLYKLIGRALPGYKDRSAMLHLQDLRNRIKAALDYQRKNYPESPAKSTFSAAPENFDFQKEWRRYRATDENSLGCWSLQVERPK